MKWLPLFVQCSSQKCAFWIFLAPTVALLLATFDLLNYGDLSEQKCVPCLVEPMNADAADAPRKGGQGSKGGGRDTQVYLI